jgi:uncharacterized protein (TIGR03067 family)
MTRSQRSELAKLQGTWRITALEMDGGPSPAVTFEGATIVVDGDHFTSLGMGAPYEGTIEIDAEKMPKRFDLLFTVGHAAGVRNLGIYKLDGNRWTICLATRGGRPRSFTTKPGNGVALETLERGEAARSTPVESPTTETLSGPATTLEGDWTMVAGVFNGVAMDAAMAAFVRRVTRGDITTVFAGQQVMLEARFTVDESRQPAFIDYVNLAGSNKGKSQAGLFQLRGETLEICVAGPGKPRPTEFASEARDGRSYTTWRRQAASL